MDKLNTVEIREAFKTDEIDAHWVGCYLTHRRCAIARLCDKVDQLEAVITKHELCHDSNYNVGPREFATGCAAKQREVFGCAPDADRVAELEAEVARLKEELSNWSIYDY